MKCSVLALSGPSGVGKGYLRTHLMGRQPLAVPLTFVTTRFPRESDGPDLVSGVSDAAFVVHHGAKRIDLVVATHGHKYGMWMPGLAVARQLGVTCITEVHPTQVARWREQLDELVVVGLSADDSLIRENLEIRGEPELAARLAAVGMERTALIEHHQAGRLDELIEIRSRDPQEWESIVTRVVDRYLQID